MTPADLLAKLEGAECGSEALDVAIADAILERAPSVRLASTDIYIPMWRYPDGSVGTELRFTRSVDAALSLVPEGAQWSAGMRNRKSWGIREGAPDIYWADISISDDIGCDTAARTPALALCIAILRVKTL